MSSGTTSHPGLDEQQLLEVLRAIKSGDFTKLISDGQSGTAGEIATTVNGIVHLLNSLVAENTRMAREIGTEGKFGGQMEVPGVSGTWKDVVVNVNTMSANLTNQFRDIAAVITAMARGDLSKKVTVPCEGEVVELKQTINMMMDQVLALAGEVARIEREIGAEGRFGGQAEVKAVTHTWKDIVDSVNYTSANLTNQMRDFKNTLRAANEGDFAKRVTVGCNGETLEVKESINTLLDSAGGESADAQRRFFLANVSHELRTPLNSMAILANLLAENKDGNLTPEQVKFASVIHASAHDQLTLINKLLELSQAEGAGA